MTEKNKTQEIITEASSQGLTVKQRVQIGNRRRVKRRRNFVLPLICFAVLFALMFCIGSIESNSAASAKSPEGTPNSGLQLTFLGDIMMGRYIGQMCDDKGYDRLFSGISGIWSNSDHVFANFGSPVRICEAKENTIEIQLFCFIYFPPFLRELHICYVKEIFALHTVLFFRKWG